MGHSTNRWWTNKWWIVAAIGFVLLVVALLVDFSPTRDEIALGDAAYDGDTGRVQELLAEGVDPNARSDSGFPFITEAAAGGHLDVIELLYAAGADPAELDDNGDTALVHVAIGSGDVAIAQWLIDRGVDPCTPPSEKRQQLLQIETAVDIALLYENSDLAEYLEATTNCSTIR